MNLCYYTPCTCLIELLSLKNKTETVSVIANNRNASNYSIVTDVGARFLKDCEKHFDMDNNR